MVCLQIGSPSHRNRFSTVQTVLFHHKIPLKYIHTIIEAIVLRVSLPYSHASSHCRNHLNEPWNISLQINIYDRVAVIASTCLLGVWILTGLIPTNVLGLNPTQLVGGQFEVPGSILRDGSLSFLGTDNLGRSLLARIASAIQHTIWTLALPILVAQFAGWGLSKFRGKAEVAFRYILILHARILFALPLLVIPLVTVLSSKMPSWMLWGLGFFLWSVAPSYLFFTRLRETQNPISISCWIIGFSRRIRASLIIWITLSFIFSTRHPSLPTLGGVVRENLILVSWLDGFDLQLSAIMAACILPCFAASLLADSLETITDAPASADIESIVFYPGLIEAQRDSLRTEPKESPALNE